MNVLGYQCGDANLGSFTLLVDGQPLGALIGGMDRDIPFYLVEEGLPRPTDIAELQWVNGVAQYRGRIGEVHVVGVCSCGEAGCGCTVCRVVREGEAVVFRDFLGPGIPRLLETGFRFSLSNYQAVMGGIAQCARRAQQAMNQPRQRGRRSAR
jgi:hypothetical protein